jgi:hypothetical protein
MLHTSLSTCSASIPSPRCSSLIPPDLSLQLAPLESSHVQSLIIRLVNLAIVLFLIMTFASLALIALATLGGVVGAAVGGVALLSLSEAVCGFGRDDAF